MALEEALSCNVPLLVWDVTSMNQEYGYNYADIPATVIPYWNDLCGEYFRHIQDLPSIFQKFLGKISSYKPREFILENLSLTRCEKRFIDVLDELMAR
jgi:hypothetical protein